MLGKNTGRVLAEPSTNEHNDHEQEDDKRLSGGHEPKWLGSCLRAGGLEADEWVTQLTSHLLRRANSNLN